MKTPDERSPNNVIRRLLQLHELCDERGGRTTELRPEFASPGNPYPWTPSAQRAQAGKNWAAKTAARNREIVALRMAGVPVSYICDRFGLHRRRVHTIIRYSRNVPQEQAKAAGGA